MKFSFGPFYATTSQLMEDKNAAELEADNYRKELAALKSKAIDGLASVAPRVCLLPDMTLDELASYQDDQYDQLCRRRAQALK